MIRLERRAHEVRAVVDVPPTDEWAHARVDAVAAAQQCGHGLTPETVAPGAKRAGRDAERLLERGSQALDLGQLQVGRQVLEHGIPRD